MSDDELAAWTKDKTEREAAEWAERNRNINRLVGAIEPVLKRIQIDATLRSLDGLLERMAADSKADDADQTRELDDRESELVGRSFLTIDVRAATIDRGARTVDAVLSTESPVWMLDYARGEAVPEVLLSDAVQLPTSRQVPLLDSHLRNDTNDMLGSVRNIRKSEKQLLGTLHFDVGAAHAWGLVAGGHITDVSVGYHVMARTYVGPQASKVINGRTFEGPVSVVTSWRLFEVSLVSIGADEMAKLRARESVETWRR